jgi:hypothetical protein
LVDKLWNEGSSLADRLVALTEELLAPEWIEGSG